MDFIKPFKAKFIMCERKKKGKRSMGIFINSS